VGTQKVQCLRFFLPLQVNSCCLYLFAPSGPVPKRGDLLAIYALRSAAKTHL
jgi:hypothetical protein